jgi:hypothetical protein
MSRPWDNEPTPLTDAARLHLECEDSCCAVYTYSQHNEEYSGDIVRADKMADLERRLRHAERLLEGIMQLMDGSQGLDGWHRNGDIATWDEFEDRQMIEQYLAAAKEADQ